MPTKLDPDRFIRPCYQLLAFLCSLLVLPLFIDKWASSTSDPSTLFYELDIFRALDGSGSSNFLGFILAVEGLVLADRFFLPEESELLLELDFVRRLSVGV